MLKNLLQSVSTSSSSTVTYTKPFSKSLPLEIWGVVLNKLHDDYNPNNYLYETFKWTNVTQYSLVNKQFKGLIVSLIKTNPFLKGLDIVGGVGLPEMLTQEINKFYNILSAEQKAKFDLFIPNSRILNLINTKLKLDQASLKNTMKHVNIIIGIKIIAFLIFTNYHRISNDFDYIFHCTDILMTSAAKELFDINLALLQEPNYYYDVKANLSKYQLVINTDKLDEFIEHSECQNRKRRDLIQDIAYIMSDNKFLPVIQSIIRHDYKHEIIKYIELINNIRQDEKYNSILDSLITVTTEKHYIIVEYLEMVSIRKIINSKKDSAQQIQAINYLYTLNSGLTNKVASNQLSDYMKSI